MYLSNRYMEFTLPIIYFLFDCHKVPISDRQSQSMLILWTDKVIKVASRRGIINMKLEMSQKWAKEELYKKIQQNMPFFLARIRNRGPGAETGSVSRPNTGSDRIWIRNPARMKQIGIKISKDPFPDHRHRNRRLKKLPPKISYLS